MQVAAPIFGTSRKEDIGGGEINEKGIGEGAPVLGCLQWSFPDYFEWSRGYDERFGGLQKRKNLI